MSSSFFCLKSSWLEKQASCSGTLDSSRVVASHSLASLNGSGMRLWEQLCPSTLERWHQVFFER